MEGWSTTTAVILAGGLGTRLRSVVSDRPKALAEIHGRPFLCYLLEQLAAAGVPRAVICSGHLGEQLESALGRFRDGLSLTYSRETTPLGTGGALRAALPLVDSDPLLVLNGDSYFDVDWAAFWSFATRSENQPTLALAEAPDTQRFGRVALAADGRIAAFEEKGASRGPGWINAGIYLLSREKLGAIPPDRQVSLERECFLAWIESGLYGFAGGGKFLDIGTPASYALASKFFTPAAESLP